MSLCASSLRSIAINPSGRNAFTINDEDSKKALVTRNSYDEMGQLKTKQIGQKRSGSLYTADPLETLEYSYNARGWLKGISTAYSHPELIGGGNTDHWFGMELNYGWGSTDASLNQFNGNISSTTWKSKADGVRRAYGFSYDKANRLMGGDFSEYSGSSYSHSSAIDFSMDGRWYNSCKCV